ncbi:unnamed protein product [Soboliphyme baturini]|uniref:Transposase n=1 Tax=Soboliphyme baturini TaxID=241478 RepID=A0A183IKM9_9BILA|nr:unnamed protein product [Soboliphyme baturini]
MTASRLATGHLTHASEHIQRDHQTEFLCGMSSVARFTSPVASQRVYVYWLVGRMPPVHRSVHPTAYLPGTCGGSHERLVALTPCDEQIYRLKSLRSAM